MNAVKLTLCKRETFRRKCEPIRYEYTSVLLVQDSKKIKQYNRKVESFVYV